MQLKFEFEQGEFIKKKTIESEKQIIKLKTESLENEIKLRGSIP